MADTVRVCDDEDGCVFADANIVAVFAGADDAGGDGAVTVTCTGSDSRGLSKLRSS